MKKILQLTVLFVILMGFSACSPKEPAQNAPVTKTPSSPIAQPKVDLAGLCAKEKGNWITEYQECEGVGADWCQTSKGQYDGCASACRHDANAQICTMQCVLVCSFAQAGEPAKAQVTAPITVPGTEVIKTPTTPTTKEPAKTPVKTPNKK
jgi:hypothetical protein